MLTRQLGLTLLLPAAALAQPPAAAPDLERVTQQIIEQTNQFRRAEGRGSVAVNAKLAATARDFAAFMARTDMYGHEADGRQPADRAKKHGYDYCLVAENIAYAFRSPGFTTEELAKQFVTGWQNSPGHRKNMLDPDVTETAVVIARSETTGYYYAVQLFGRPRSASIEFRIINRAGVAVRYAVEDRDYDLPPNVTMTHQLCRPEVVTFRWPSATDAPAAPTVRPTAGDQYTVVRGAGGGFEVKRMDGK
jgi:uncharacterized protein YkwD